MGWTVHYRVELEQEMTAGEKKSVGDLFARYNDMLCDGSESLWLESLDPDKQVLDSITGKQMSQVAQMFGGYEERNGEVAQRPYTVQPEHSYLWGFTKVAFSEDPTGDYLKVIACMRELDEVLPKARIFVFDDYVLVHRIEASKIPDDEILCEQLT